MSRVTTHSKLWFATFLFSIIGTSLSLQAQKASDLSESDQKSFLSSPWNNQEMLLEQELNSQVLLQEPNNIAFIQQQGRFLDAQQIQIGTENRALILQQGTGQVAVQEQFGNRLVSFISQSGEGNRACSRQIK